MIVGLQAHKHSRFGGAIKLLQVDANRAVEREQIGANGFTRGVGYAHTAKAEAVAQWAVDHEVAQAIQQAVEQANRFALHALRANFHGQAHEVFVQAALYAAGIFHANAHTGEHALEHPRRRKVVSRTNLFQVDHDSGSRLRAIDHVAGYQPLCVAENILTNPGGWQISQHIFIRREVIKFGASLCAVDQGTVRVHNTFGIARGARSEEHGGHVVFGASFNLLFVKMRVLFGKNFTSRQQFVH